VQREKLACVKAAWGGEFVLLSRKLTVLKAVSESLLFLLNVLPKKEDLLFRSSDSDIRTFFYSQQFSNSDIRNQCYAVLGRLTVVVGARLSVEAIGKGAAYRYIERPWLQAELGGWIGGFPCS